MVSKGGRLWARTYVSVQQNRAALGFVLGWIAINAVVFAKVVRLPPSQALLAALCIHKTGSAWGHFYASFTEVVVFGAIASVVVTNVTRRYRPEATCAELAAHTREHLVIIGYSHLGRRVRSLVLSVGGSVVVIEEDRALAQPIIDAEEPLVLGSAREPLTLATANVSRAKVVIIATDNLETAAIACRLVRAENPRCKLVVRCPDDDVGQILAKAYNARALSTSKIAARLVLEHAVKAGSRKALVVGTNNIGHKVMAALQGERIACTQISEKVDTAALERAGIVEMDLVVIADDDLGKNLVQVDRIRDVNPNAHVICRVFHEEAAEVLTQNPFRCVLLSSSRLAADALANEGLLREVGVTKGIRKGLAQKGERRGEKRGEKGG